jgi:hypothetical protein
MSEPAWKCPGCGLTCELPRDRVEDAVVHASEENTVGSRAFRLRRVICPNHACRQLQVSVSMHLLWQDGPNVRAEPEPMQAWPILPEAGVRALPKSVPVEVGQEYIQARKLMPISLSAAATFARRCLQAMIRDFWGIKKNFLSEEVNALQEKVDPETWQAIDSVRQMGQVARHLEKGVNLIQEGDANEADMLLRLIDYLIDDWYVARENRMERLATIKSIRSPGDG